MEVSPLVPGPLGLRFRLLQYFHGICTCTKHNSWWISYSWLNHFPPEVCGVMCGLTQHWLSEGWRGRVKHSPDSAQHLRAWLTQSVECSLDVTRMDLLLFLALSKRLVVWSLPYHTLPIPCSSRHHVASCPLAFHTSLLTFPRPSVWSHNHIFSGGSPCAPGPTLRRGLLYHCYFPIHLEFPLKPLSHLHP